MTWEQLMEDAETKAAIETLLAKLKQGEDVEGTYVFNRNEVSVLQEMMTIYSSGKGAWMAFRVVGKAMIWLAAVYGAYLALKNGFGK